ncbi:MAG: hypothetical protein ACK54K_13540, partial [Gemmatimonadaceae bacterium]
MARRRFAARLHHVGLAATSLLAACGGSDLPAGGAEPLADGPFARIQRTIIEPSCAGCHRSGSSDARQSGLVLSADSSYQQMVSAPSLHPKARADGLLRIK